MGKTSWRCLQFIWKERILSYYSRFAFIWHIFVKAKCSHRYFLFFQLHFVFYIFLPNGISFALCSLISKKMQLKNTFSLCILIDPSWSVLTTSRFGFFNCRLDFVHENIMNRMWNIFILALIAWLIKCGK